MGRTLVLVALYLAGVGSAAQVAKIISVFGPLRSGSTLTLSQAALVMSAVGIAAIALGSSAGHLVVRLGLWRMLASAAGLSVIAGMVLPMAHGFWALMVVRFIEGLGHIVIVSAAPTLMVALAPRQHATLVLGLWSSFFGVAFAVSQLFAWTGLNETAPSTFLRWHVVLFLPALAVATTHLGQDRTVGKANRPTPGVLLLPRTLTSSQFSIALAFLFHAGIFTSMLAFAQLRIGGELAKQIAPLLPLVSLMFTFVGSFLLTHFAARSTFGLGAVCLGFALLVAAKEPFYGYIGAFAGIGIMQSAIFARIGETCSTDEETSVMNGAYTQLGNLGNVVIPYIASLVMGSLKNVAVEYLLVVLVACAGLLQKAQRFEVRDAI